MTQAPTPLTFNDSGAGWHLHPRRRYLLLVGALLVAAMLATAAVKALVDGKVWAAVPLLVLAGAVAVLPFDNSRRRLAPTTYDGPEGRGTLLPVHGVRVVSILAMLVFGLLLLLVPVFAVTEGLDGSTGDNVLMVVISLFLLLFGLLMLVGAYGGVRSRLTPSKGILLTPTRIVLRTQAQPMSFGWEVVRGVWPHWTRHRGWTDLVPTPEDPIHNWLSFDVEPGRFDGENPLGPGARTSSPTLDAEKLASDPDAVLGLCRLYLEHPELREELGMPAALERFRALASGG
ncbi:hypothetical protein [Nocardioides sp. cx-173]|uniref:hypothetical protein n=1 Tax=Nocardioides sp. cx-173 TaxID=2898796 RepID=UPI001E34E563|nr:hypothetical protein [Nocardioides sp. cx-173]MCD4524294.1 hypothetical protein [Nocardioides sp. cx-173]UGB41686.1 hypothetical protein LQ940_20305 [Nocardioides sp. cx-173]